MRPTNGRGVGSAPNLLFAGYVPFEGDRESGYKLLKFMALYAFCQVSFSRVVVNATQRRAAIEGHCRKVYRQAWQRILSYGALS